MESAPGPVGKLPLKMMEAEVTEFNRAHNLVIIHIGSGVLVRCWIPASIQPSIKPGDKVPLYVVIPHAHT